MSSMSRTDGCRRYWPYYRPLLAYIPLHVSEQVGRQPVGDLFCGPAEVQLTFFFCQMSSLPVFADFTVFSPDDFRRAFAPHPVRRPIHSVDVEMCRLLIHDELVDMPYMR